MWYVRFSFFSRTTSPSPWRHRARTSTSRCSAARVCTASGSGVSTLWTSSSSTTRKHLFSPVSTETSSTLSNPCSDPPPAKNERYQTSHWATPPYWTPWWSVLTSKSANSRNWAVTLSLLLLNFLFTTSDILSSLDIKPSANKSFQLSVDIRDKIRFCCRSFDSDFTLRTDLSWQEVAF